MNSMNEKLCIGDWLKERAEVLEKEGKLGEAVKRLDPEARPEEAEGFEGKRALLESAYKKDENKDELNVLYFDYLCDREKYHLTD